MILGGRDVWTRLSVIQPLIYNIVHLRLGHNDLNSMTKRLLNIWDVLRQLHREVEETGSQSEWARRTGVSRTYLNKVMRGSRVPGPQIFEALNVKSVVVCAGPNGNDLIPFLRRAVAEAGSISAWSRKTGIDRAVVSLVINGKRPPSAQLFHALKQKRVTAYIPQAR